MAFISQVIKTPIFETWSEKKVLTLTHIVALTVEYSSYYRVNIRDYDVFHENMTLCV